MAQAGREIYELFYGGKDPKEVFHNAEVPKSSRQKHYDEIALKDEEISCIQTDFNTFKSKAKDIIRNLLRVTYGEGWNYSLDWKVKAEQFLKECE